MRGKAFMIHINCANTKSVVRGNIQGLTEAQCCCRGEALPNDMKRPLGR